MALSSEAVESMLEKMMASPAFATADRMRRFLRFVVSKTLSGEAESLKEYLIGVEVFDRGDGFDPRTDTIVRVEARRLRKKIDEYYIGPGSADSIRIGLPSGSYVPVFDEVLIAAPAPPPGSLRRRIVLAGGGAAAAAAIAAIWYSRLSPGANFSSIAVLPFLDLSQGKDHEYFCDGITEEMINSLSQIPGLSVVARTSSFRFKNAAQDIRRIGKELAAEVLLEGSVRRAGERVRITAQLIRAADGYHLWSREFDGDDKDLLRLQEEISNAVAGLVRKRAQPQTRPLPDRDAYLLYLEGRYFWNQFAPPSLHKAIRKFEEAIERDPNFAPAHSGLADAYSVLIGLGAGPAPTILPKVRQAADRALALDDSNAEAHTALAQFLIESDWNWTEAEKHFQRAIQLNPNYVNARWLYATICLAQTHRLDEALRQAQAAENLDPVSPLAVSMVGAVRLYRRQYPEALAQFNKALELAPNFLFAEELMMYVLIARKNYPEALKVAQTLSDTAAIGHIQARLGNSTEAIRQLQRLKDLAKTRYANPLGFAFLNLGLGDLDQVFPWLQKAADERVLGLVWVPLMEVYADLYLDSRYPTLLARMHLKS